jgi:mRNA interferase MazF
MNRGDIYVADLSPTVGSEINKRRLVLIVSNNANNRAANTITVLPITSNVSKIYPFEILLTPHLPKPSKVQAQQIRTISKERIVGKCAGNLGSGLMHLTEEAMRLHLAL